MIRFFTEKAAKNVLENDDPVGVVTGEEDNNKENGVRIWGFLRVTFHFNLTVWCECISVLDTLYGHFCQLCNLKFRCGTLYVCQLYLLFSESFLTCSICNY